jgi:hypothetical protein
MCKQETQQAFIFANAASQTSLTAPQSVRFADTCRFLAVAKLVVFLENI